jgi:hypothetical protein
MNRGGRVVNRKVKSTALFSSGLTTSSILVLATIGTWVSSYFTSSSVPYFLWLSAQLICYPLNIFIWFYMAHALSKGIRGDYLDRHVPAVSGAVFGTSTILGFSIFLTRKLGLIKSEYYLTWVFLSISAGTSLIVVAYSLWLTHYARKRLKYVASGSVFRLLTVTGAYSTISLVVVLGLVLTIEGSVTAGVIIILASGFMLQALYLFLIAHVAGWLDGKCCCVLPKGVSSAGDAETEQPENSGAIAMNNFMKSKDSNSSNEDLSS